MFHSVTINGKNSWTDYHMVPVNGIYLPSSPEQKVTTIDIPSSNGTIDISTLLTGYPVFNNRMGDLQYYILNPTDFDAYAEVGGTQNPDDWPSAYEVYSQILNDIHCTTGYMYFEDDPQWQYKGKFTVTGFDTTTLRRSVTIHYEVGPYKIARTGNSVTVNGEAVGTYNYVQLGPDNLGTMPNNPVVTVSGLGSEETGTVRIWKPAANGSYVADSKYYIDRVVGAGKNGVAQQWANMLFYKNAKLGFSGPSTSSAVFAYYKGRL